MCRGVFWPIVMLKSQILKYSNQKRTSLITSNLQAMQEFNNQGPTSTYGCMHARHATRPNLAQTLGRQANKDHGSYKQSRLDPSLHQRTSRPCASPQEQSSTLALLTSTSTGWTPTTSARPCSGLRQATSDSTRLCRL